MTLSPSPLSALKRFAGITAISAGVSAGLFVGTSAPLHAEGSATLYQNGQGSRAFLEWRAGNNIQTGSYLGGRLIRRTLLRVYANAGEFILLGSSATGQGLSESLIFSPGQVPLPSNNRTPGQPSIVGTEPIPNNPTFSCNAQRTATGANLGLIATRAQEQTGPNTILNPAVPVAGGTVTNGYTPCFFQAPTSGIYTVVFLGPAGASSDGDPTPNGDIATVVQPGGANDTTVAAWEVSVRTSLDSPAVASGRLFTYYLSLFTGNNGRPIDSTVFPVTTDGYIYQTNFNGIDPNGFVAYGNRVGYLDSDGVTPLNGDVLAANPGSPGANQLESLAGGVSAAPPEFPIFFNQPSGAALSALQVPPPIAPVVTPNSFGFQGSLNANNSLFNTGGTFSYQANVAHNYRIVLSRDGVNFDPELPQNRVLDGVRNSGGTSTVVWDGLDNSGTPFPVGNNYQARLVIRGGEYHFPLLDVENSTVGGPSYRLTNPPNGVCPALFNGSCTEAFYDDRGYRTANGSIVGAVRQPFPGGPAVANSDPVLGFDSTSAQRAFSNNFGDQKGLDLWTYYPSQPANTLFNIVSVADLSLTKTVDNPAATVGQPVTFTLTLTNKGPSTATNVAVTDPLPPGVTFISSTPSQSYNNATGVWTVGTVPVNGTATLQVTVSLTTSNPVINTAEVTASDQSDPNSTPNNNNPNEDDQASATLGLPNFRLVKRITAASRNNIQSLFTSFVDDPTDTNDTAPGWSQFSPVGVVQLDPNAPLESGDQVEYTVYFLSDGIGPAIASTVCDQIPARTTLVPTSIQIQRGLSAPVTGGLVYPALAPLPNGNACQNQANPTGSVIFDLGDVPATPGLNFGFVRFRVIVN